MSAAYTCKDEKEHDAMSQFHDGQELRQDSRLAASAGNDKTALSDADLGLVSGAVSPAFRRRMRKCRSAYMLVPMMNRNIGLDAHGT